MLTSSQITDWSEISSIPTNLAYYPITVNASCPETFPYANITGVPNFVVNSTSNLFMGQVYYNKVLNHPNSYPWANLTGVPSTFAPSHNYFVYFYVCKGDCMTSSGWITPYGIV